MIGEANVTLAHRLMLPVFSWNRPGDMEGEGGDQGQGGSAQDNPPAESGNQGATDPNTPVVPEQGQAGADNEPYRELGYQSWDDLRNHHNRYKQQVSGSQAEIQRVQQAASEREEFYRQQLLTLQNQILAGQQQQPKDEPMTLQGAIDAWTNGDAGAIARYEQQQAARYGQPQLTADQLRQAVDQHLQERTRPAQFAESVRVIHPELGDPKTDVYARVYNEYDDFVAQNGGYYAFSLPQDDAAMRDVPSPDGITRKRIDLRIVKELAWKVKADLAREAGRREEFDRQNRPVVGGTQKSTTPANEPDAWNLFSQSERDFMTELSVKGSQPEGWPRDARAMAKYRFDRMSADEKAKRVAAARG